ncbi:MAG: TonB-dependent receptor [Caulobacteraceae bacterium]|nr:TonB-dependent receptor [Caulobacteraceae bacterium]
MSVASGVLAGPALAWSAEAPAQPAAAVSEIVVTAQRRSENIQTVPLGVSAITGETLQKQGAVNFTDYAHTIPNLSFGTGNGFGVTTAREVTIRGIAGANTTNFYINDTPVPLSLDPRVLDLQRVEVLRGPQGTLFGSSAMGGTVRIITRQADSRETHGYIDVQGFDVNKGGAGYDVSGTFNTPIIEDQLGLKVSAYSSYTPGIFTGEYGVATTPGYTVPSSQPVGYKKHLGDDSEYGGLATLTFTPKAVPGLTVTPMLIYQHMQGNGLPLADFNPRNLVQIRPLNVSEGVRDQWVFAALTAKYDAGFGEFISSSSLFHRQAFDNEDGTEAATVLFGAYATPPLSTVYQASPSPSYVNTVAYTQELRFQSKFNGPLQVIVGGYYNETRSHTIQRELTPIDGAGDIAFEEDVPRLNRELAGFANLTFAPTKAIELSAGVREAHLEYHYAYVADGWINGGPSNSPTSHSEDALTPRFTAKYQITDGDMIYANVAKGYRVGGQNATLPSMCDADLAAAGLPNGSVSYGSDSLWSYELGAKDSWFNGRMKTRLAAYHIDWSNIQQVILLPCTYHLTLNAGAATSDGAELEADVVPIDNLTLSFSLGYDDAKITKSPAGSNFVVGQPLNGVPRWTASLLGDYEIPTSFGAVFVRGQYNFTGQSISYNNDPAGRVRKAYSMVDLRVGASKGPWEASLFAKNLFDVRADLGDEQSEISEMPGRPRYLIAQPRTIGLDVKRSF